MYVTQSRTLVEIWNPAKLNLFLEVKGRRTDGFHEIETLMVPIGIYDTLRARPTSDGKIQLKSRWADGCNSEISGELPPEDQNLVFRAFDAVRREAMSDMRADTIETSLPESSLPESSLPESSLPESSRPESSVFGTTKPFGLGAVVDLYKRIPAAAGLGGGSSDAAAAIVAANLIWNLRWSTERLARIGANLGSDIPFFIESQSAVCVGRGEQIHPIKQPSRRFHFVVARPSVGLSTAKVYGLTELPKSDSQQRVDSIRRQFTEGRSELLAKSLFNRLQPAAEKLSPWISRLKIIFDATDALGHQMSGSGSSYFAVCRNGKDAVRTAKKIQSHIEGQVFAVPSTGWPLSHDQHPGSNPN